MDVCCFAALVVGGFLIAQIIVLQINLGREKLLQTIFALRGSSPSVLLKLRKATESRSVERLLGCNSRA